ncbi:MAG: response regulator, partial [Desulfobacterales bacterium]|nr:response regulator [Desulfobacterales bacterium]
LDVNLPGLSGVDICRRIKNDAQMKHLPIIFISALGETNLKVKAFEAGAIDYVTKPIESSELLVRIESHLGMIQLQQQLTKEIAEHQRTEEELEKHQNHLEQMVKDRTAELEQEIYERKQAEQKLDLELSINKALAFLAKDLVDPENNIKNIANNVLSSAQKLTGSEHGYVSEIDRETGNNMGHTLTSMMGDTCDLSAYDPPVAFPKDEVGAYPKLWGHALNTGDAFYTNSPVSHPRFTGLPEGHVPLTNFLSVPVKFGDEVIGQIALCNTPTGFTAWHLEATERLSALYALAILRHRREQDNAVMEIQLRHAQKMEAMGTLAGGIAHDFNNILYPMIGFAEILQEDVPGGSPLQDHVSEVLKGALRAKDLVKQILTFSRKDDKNIQAVQIQTILEEVIKLLTSSIPKTIDIQSDIDPGCGLVMAESTQVHQIIMNLSTNAYHSMQTAGGRLTIRLKQEEIKSRPTGFSKIEPGQYAVLSVIDTGSGIPEELLDKIFDPYFTTKEKGKGTGLGLSVVQGIVESFNGEIHVTSKPNKGTQFHVYLPVIEDNEENAPPADLSLVSGGQERVLLVDDEPAIVKMEATMLERLGYHVTPAEGSLEAIEIFKNRPDQFDLIISDMTMPDKTGIQLKEIVRKIRADIPIIICTGFSDQIS